MAARVASRTALGVLEDDPLRADELERARQVTDQLATERTIDHAPIVECALELLVGDALHLPPSSVVELAPVLAGLHDDRRGIHKAEHDPIDGRDVAFGLE